MKVCNLDEMKEIIKKEGKVNCSKIQRCMYVDYFTAISLIEAMQEQGFLGEYLPGYGFPVIQTNGVPNE